ncbi:hypothetical protein CTZ24_21370 (plasmid) [Pantoea phytobeneficialis]|uniref:E3 ubiquitin-protein ligase SopA-like catalytic domain-containing protein n=1 Tax=Pantoea phytobeneficialis TaxID=2052056 RepID=A0AAP9KRD9_9GAMM|nr:hypothetical protein CTZ24_21370 [Pantoea phytobeneficialis]
MHWNHVIISNANFENLRIYGLGNGKSSEFMGFTLCDVNLRGAEINDVHFLAGDDNYLRGLIFCNTKLNNVAFLGHASVRYDISATDFSEAVLHIPQLAYVCFSSNVNISQSKWLGLKITGPVDGAGIICENYQEDDITWHPDMFQKIESLRCSVCPEKGAFFILMMRSMKEKNSRIVVDAVNQMVRHIKQSTPALTACLRDKSIRRALIAELRDPLYSACTAIQLFRENLLFQHYQYELLRPDDAEKNDLSMLLETLPVERVMRLQVVINQLAASKEILFGSMMKSARFAELIAYAEQHLSECPYLFINEEKSEIVCLSEKDFGRLLEAEAAPKHPQLIRYHKQTGEIEKVITSAEAVADIRHKNPLLNTLWRHAEYAPRPMISLLFSYRDTLSTTEVNDVNDIVEHIHSLLLHRSVKKDTLFRHRKLLPKLLSPFCGSSYRENCQKLIDQVCKQFSNHPVYSSYTTEQQQSVAVIALIKLFVELSTQQYLGTSMDLAKWLVEPIKKMFMYACESFSPLFSKYERERWEKALITKGLETERDAQTFLSTIKNYKFPFLAEQETQNILNELYPLVAFGDD